MADKFSLDDIIKQYSKPNEHEDKDKENITAEDTPKESASEFDNAVNIVKAEETKQDEVPAVDDLSETQQDAEIVPTARESIFEAHESDTEVKTDVSNGEDLSEQPVVDANADDKPLSENNHENETPAKKIHSLKHSHRRPHEEAEHTEIDNEAALKAEKRRESIRNAENATVINNLMKLKRERGTVKKNQNVSPVNRATVKDLKMGLTGKIIPKTEELDKALDIPDDATYEEKTKLIYERRRKKIDSFKLKTLEESKSKKAENKNNESKSGQKEFESYEQALKILRDILQVKGNLVLRLCVLLFTAIFSLLITAGNDWGFPLTKAFDRTVNPSAYVFANTILGIISIGVSYTVMLAGIKNLFKRNADCDSVAALGIFIATIAGIITLFDAETIQDGYFHMYMSVAIAGLIFNTLGKLLIVKRTEKNFRYAAGEYDRYALINIDDEDVANKFTKGSLNDFPELATMRKTEFVEDFMKNSYSSDISDRFAKKTAPFIVAAGLFIGLLSLICDRHASGFTQKFFTLLASMSGTVSICSSLVLMLVVNIPLAKASKKYLQYSAVMLGYSSVEEFADTNSVLVDAQQLFPNGMVDFVNLKLFSSTMIEECILMAASLACQANSVLKPTFYKMLRGKTEMLYPVESYIYEDGLGLSGWIENKRVLLGNRELMENHSIEGIPTLAKEREYAKGNIVLYLSISGVVSTLFVVRANPSLSVSRWLQQLESEGITTVIRTVDGFINLNFISELFDINPSSIKLLPFRYHKDYEKETDYQPRISSSMLCSGHFPSFAMLVIGAKRLKIVSNLGIALQFGASALGAILAFIMMVTGAFTQITPSLVLGYQLAFGVITMLVQNLSKKP